MNGEPKAVPTRLGVAAAVTGLAGLTLIAPAPPAALAAVIIQGSSTNQSGAGIEDFFGGRFDDDPVYVNFLTGPVGIGQALNQSPDADNTVVSSGWGAANASLLISYLKATDPDNPALTNTTWVLDNNVANPNGGFGTRYPLFALIGVNPIPTPANPGATVISTAYEYDINGNAPKYILNPFADANSLAAYFDRRLTQSELTLPVDDDGNPLDAAGSPVSCDQSCDYPVQFEDGTTARVQKVDGVVYVGYQARGLPLVQPLRDYGGQTGNKVADAVEPALTALVDYGYPDNDPLANPGTLERAALVPSAAETKTFVQNFVTGVKKGADTLTDDYPTANRARTSFKKLSAPVKPAFNPPKPKPLGVQAGVDRLTKAFGTHKRAGKPDDKKPTGQQGQAQ